MHEINLAINDETIQALCEHTINAYREGVKASHRRIRVKALADAYISALSILIDLDELEIIKAANYSLQYHSHGYPQTMIKEFIDSLEFSLRQKKLNPRQQS